MTRGIHRQVPSGRSIAQPRRAWKRALSAGVTLALVLSMTLAGSASANSGSITSSQSCSEGAVHVFLNNNVSSDRKVTVTSTIPDFTTTNITNKSYNTTGNAGPVEIWSASGPQPFAGVVTLTIKYSNGAVENAYSKTMTAQDPCPAPGFTVDKGVSLSANGPFVAELTTTTGTTVHYRITITNTGNVALTGVTLSDNTFGLVAKGCTVPTSLAVAAHYDCDYTSTAVTGTTTNIATGDTDQTGPDTGTAKVVAAPPPAPGFTVDKGVSLSANGPFVAELTTTTGTTVHYRITITNTGNVALTGVTLSDNTFGLVAKGCTVPTSLAVARPLRLRLHVHRGHRHHDQHRDRRHRPDRTGHRHRQGRRRSAAGTRPARHQARRNRRRRLRSDQRRRARRHRPLRDHDRERRGRRGLGRGRLR